MLSCLVKSKLVWGIQALSQKSRRETLIRQSIYIACTRPCVQFPEPKEKNLNPVLVPCSCQVLGNFWKVVTTRVARITADVVSRGSAYTAVVQAVIGKIHLCKPDFTQLQYRINDSPTLQKQTLSCREEIAYKMLSVVAAAAKFTNICHFCCNQQINESLGRVRSVSVCKVAVTWLQIYSSHFSRLWVPCTAWATHTVVLLTVVGFFSLSCRGIQRKLSLLLFVYFVSLRTPS